IVQQQEALTVRVRVLNADESRRYFGASIAGLGVQPVWLQVQNDSDAAVRYVPILTDPDYFSPQEVAQGLHRWFSGTTNRLVDAVVERSHMQSYIPAHSVASGFVYTHED